MFGDKADALFQQLVEEAKKQKLTPQQLVDRTGLPYSVAWKAINGCSRRPTLECALALAWALGMTVKVSKDNR